MSICYVVRTIPHQNQRYNTVGDYITDENNDSVIVNISEVGDSRYEFLVAIHEMLEQFLTKQRGIPEWVIDDFDKEYERYRKPEDTDEPGNSTLAPYHKEHMFATRIEKLIAKELGVDWNDYEEALDAVYLPPASKRAGTDE